MTYHRGFAPALLILVIAAALLVSFYVKNLRPTLAASVPECGIQIATKDPSMQVSTSTFRTDFGIGYVSFGNGSSTLTAICWRSSFWRSQGLTIEEVLGINQNTEALRVNKEIYPVFDAATRQHIDSLYSQTRTFPRAGVEAVGFSNTEWFYEFDFSDPAHARNSDTFGISVSKPN